MVGFPGGASGKESSCQWRRPKRRVFETWVRKIPWRRAWQPTPAFLPGESHGQRFLAGYSPWGHKESDMTEATEHAGTTVLCRVPQQPRGAVMRVWTTASSGRETYRGPAGVSMARTLPQIGRGVLEAGSKPCELRATVSSTRQGLCCCSSPSDDWGPWQQEAISTCC